MLHRTDALDALDERWERTAYTDLSLQDALTRFAALWRHARVLRGRPETEWKDDLVADLAIARAVNGPPPS